jgi:hypothetical protein
MPADFVRASLFGPNDEIGHGNATIISGLFALIVLPCQKQDHRRLVRQSGDGRVSEYR